MAVVFSDIIEQALQLAPGEKLALIESLVISLDRDPDADSDEIARAWDEEIASRIEAIEKGEVETIDGEAVLARLRTILTRAG